MAFLVPVIMGVGAGAVATAAGAGALTAAAVGAGTAVAASSLMNKGSSPAPVAPTAVPGSSSTTIADVTASQANVAAKADTTQEGATATGPAETEAMSFAQKGRQSTILTRAPGLLTEQAQAGTFRQRRTLVGEGLIT